MRPTVERTVELHNSQRIQPAHLLGLGVLVFVLVSSTRLVENSPRVETSLYSRQLYPPLPMARMPARRLVSPSFPGLMRGRLGLGRIRVLLEKNACPRARAHHRYVTPRMLPIMPPLMLGPLGSGDGESCSGRGRPPPP